MQSIFVNVFQVAASIESIYDLDRDGNVDFDDVQSLLGNIFESLNMLDLSSPPNAALAVAPVRADAGSERTDPTPPIDGRPTEVLEPNALDELWGNLHTGDDEFELREFRFTQ